MTTRNFFIFTRGRTGSTAIVDELGKHPEITTMQEIFTQLKNSPTLAVACEKYGKNFYRHIESPLQILPFDAWSRLYSSFAFPGLGHFMWRIIGSFRPED